LERDRYSPEVRWAISGLNGNCGDENEILPKLGLT
jgi:hypothetical protein